MTNNSAGPLLSIITPVYNTEKFLDLCITSIIEQEYQNWELLLINDGSTDRSLEICQRYAEQDSRIRVFSQENAGQSVARNVGLDHMRGELVVFMDSDDAIIPSTYACAIELLLKTPSCDQVQFPAHWNYTSPKYFLINVEHAPITEREELYQSWLFDNGVSWSLCNKVFRASIFRNLRLMPGILFEDNLLVAEILTVSSGICFSNEGGYLYYVRDEFPEKWEWTPRKRKDLVTCYGKIYEVLLPLFPRLTRARAEFVRRLSNITFAYLREFGRNDLPVQLAKPYIRNFRLGDVLPLATCLSLKAKLKALLMMLWAKLS